ncbi:Telomerase-binding protein-like protein [Ilyonectria robusta]
MRAISQRLDDADATMGNSALEVSPSESFKKALEFAVKTYEIVVSRWEDTNTLPFVHTMMVFMHKVAQCPAAVSYLEQVFPWKLTMDMLNYHLTSCDFGPRMDSEFPGPEKNEAPRPLPEDYAMRGLIYVDDYYPKTWFDNEKVDEYEKYFELASMVNQRKERILYLGYKIAAQDKWLKFDPDSRRFSVADKYDVDLGNVSRSSETQDLKKDGVGGWSAELRSGPEEPPSESLRPEDLAAGLEDVQGGLRLEELAASLEDIPASHGDPKM